MVIDAPKTRKKKTTNYDSVLNMRVDSFQIERIKDIAKAQGYGNYQKLVRKIIDDYIKENSPYQS